MEPAITAATTALVSSLFVPLCLGLILAVFWLICIIDVTISEFVTPSNKTVWLLLLIFLAPIGTILFMILGHSQKVKKKLMFEEYPYTAGRKKSSAENNGGKWL